MDSLRTNRNTGRASLEKARLFLRMVEVAESADPFDQSIAEINLEAAIVFGKATRDRMADYFGKAEAEASEQCGNQRSKAAKQWLKSTTLWGDPVCKLFADLRDVIVHEDGRAEVFARDTNHSLVAGAIMGTSAMASALTVTPKNPTPEQLASLEQDRERDFANRDRLLLEQQAAFARKQVELQEELRQRAELLAEKNKAIKIFFDTDVPSIRGRRAVQVVGEYLDHLQFVLDEQEGLVTGEEGRTESTTASDLLPAPFPSHG